MVVRGIRVDMVAGPMLRALTASSRIAVLVGTQPGVVISVGSGQLLGQDVGADDGDAGAAADGRAGE